MNLKALIKEARKYLQPPEEDEELDFGPRGKAARDLGPIPPKTPVAPCGPGTIRQRKPDGTSACVPLRGVKKS